MLFSDGQQIFETNFKHLIEIIYLLKRQGWFKKIIFWIIQNSAEFETVVFQDYFTCLYPVQSLPKLHHSEWPSAS